MEWAIVEVDRLDVGERAPKATLTGFPKVEFLCSGAIGDAGPCWTVPVAGGYRRNALEGGFREANSEGEQPLTFR